tara:strand:- start:329 stop:562 length:234 start_codon:yes stop_codon:yes gene_type:complete
MTQQNGTAPQIEITMEDVQAVLAEHREFALLVENKALKRALVQLSVKETTDVSDSKDVSAEVGKNSVGSASGGNSKS